MYEHRLLFHNMLVLFFIRVHSAWVRQHPSCCFNFTIFPPHLSTSICLKQPLIIFLYTVHIPHCIFYNSLFIFDTPSFCVHHCSISICDERDSASSYQSNVIRINLLPLVSIYSTLSNDYREINPCSLNYRLLFLSVPSQCSIITITIIIATISSTKKSSLLCCKYMCPIQHTLFVVLFDHVYVWLESTVINDSWNRCFGSFTILVSQIQLFKSYSKALLPLYKPLMPSTLQTSLIHQMQIQQQQQQKNRLSFFNNSSTPQRLSNLPPSLPATSNSTFSLYTTDFFVRQHSPGPTPCQYLLAHMSSHKHNQDKESKKTSSSHHHDGSGSSKGSSRSVPTSHHRNTAKSSRGASHHSGAHRGTSHGSGASNSGSTSQDLPRSVRNAPADLRPAIRRRQNNESAKRSREKKREEDAEMQEVFDQNSERIQQLEKQVDDLTTMLSVKRSMKKRHDSQRKPEYPDGGDGSGFFGIPF